MRALSVGCSLLFLASLVLGRSAVNQEPHPLDAIRPENVKHNKGSKATISATPSQLQLSGEYVVVSWSGVENPGVGDWIGVYEAKSDITKKKPTKFLYCNQAPGYLSTGAGSWNVRLINLRNDLVFVLYSGTLDAPVYLATSNVITFANYNQPLSIHLALTADSRGMVVSWVTQNASQPVVKAVPTNGGPVMLVDAVTTTYSKSDVCGHPANSSGWINPGSLHTALLPNLQPATTYTYVVGDMSQPQTSSSWSAELSFTTPSLAVDQQQVSLFCFGDLGQDQPDGTMDYKDPTDYLPSRNTTTSMLTLMNQMKPAPQLVMHIGDIAYARGYASEWDNFFDMVSPLANSLPWMVLPGNHERDWPNSGSLFDGNDSGGECGVPLNRRFAMPPSQSRLARSRLAHRIRKPAPGRMAPVGNVYQDQPWYSYVYGPITFIALSTEHDFSTGSVQYNWFLNTLQTINRQLYPWVIVAGHRPMYIDSTNDTPPNGDLPVAVILRQYLEPLMVQYGVDLAMWGHHHSYQRTCAVNNQTCVSAGQAAPVHVVIGNAGAGLSQNFNPTKPSWIQVADCTYYGFSTINADSHTLTFRAYKNGPEPSLFDEFVLRK